MQRPHSEKIVLVGVLKRKWDLNILLRERWYRIPLAKAPTRKFEYLAFYEPARFGRESKRIKYYARILRKSVHKRSDLLPDENDNPNANEKYLKFRLDRIEKLAHPVINNPPRRVSFGFATLERLFNSRTVLQLYCVAPTEEIVGKALQQSNILAFPQKHISVSGKHYCLDFAIQCRRGAIAVECDNKKAHSGKIARKRDKIKDANLKANGWKVVRLKEDAIVSDLQSCVSRIRRAIRKLGGTIVSFPVRSRARA